MERQQQSGRSWQIVAYQPRRDEGLGRRQALATFLAIKWLLVDVHLLHGVESHTVEMEPLLTLLTLDHRPRFVARTTHAINLLLHTTLAFDQSTLSFLRLLGFAGFA